MNVDYSNFVKKDLFSIKFFDFKNIFAKSKKPNNKKHLNTSIVCKDKIENNYDIIIYENDIREFTDFYNKNYYNKISKSEKNMFNIEENILSSIFSNIFPFILLIYDRTKIDIKNKNEFNLIKKYINGICILNYEMKNNKIILNISHFSSIIDVKSQNYYYILNILFTYIQREFIFDEIYLEFIDTLKFNDKIKEYFINDLNFIVDNKENENKLIYRINDNNLKNYTIKNNITNNILQKNLITFYDMITISQNNDNKNQSSSQNKDKINLIMLDYLKGSTNIKGLDIIFTKICSNKTLNMILKENNINNFENNSFLNEDNENIVSCIINKYIVDNYFNSSNLFNNISIFNMNSYKLKNFIYYNFIKPEKTYIIHNKKYLSDFYHIINKNLSFLFFELKNDEIKKYIYDESNIYLKINDLYKDFLLINSELEIKFIKDKLLWVPCFKFSKNLKIEDKNNNSIIYEYFEISNTVINNNNFNSEGLCSKFHGIILEPDYKNDFIIENDFVFGIVHNANIIEKIYEQQSTKSNEDNSFYLSSSDLPNAVFLGYISKENFVNENNIL